MTVILIRYTLNSEFVSIYGSIGFFLRRYSLNTSSRISMLASMLYLQKVKDDYVDFVDIYQFSLKTTGDKLEENSFNNMIDKLHQAHGKHHLIERIVENGRSQYRGTALLINVAEQSDIEFEDEILKQIRDYGKTD